MSDTKILCWHFLSDDGTTRGGTKPEPGGVETFDGTPVLCKCGLHGSERAIDALWYARGGIVRRVAISGEIVRGDDKIAGTVRRELWRADATKVLHEFACDVAEAALFREREAGREPDARSWAAIATKRKWLAGEATASALAAAGDAAWDAAVAAALAAARPAARDAAWAAARAAAGAAAWAADAVAARAAAVAADDAAAQAADDAAAWAAAGAANNDMLTARLEALCHA